MSDIDKLTVKEWAKGAIIDNGEDEEDAAENSQNKNYLLQLMEDVDAKSIEVGSKFLWILNEIENSECERILIFSSWYVSHVCMRNR